MGLFRGDVLCGANHHAGPRERHRFGGFGDAEVSNFDGAVGCDQQVAGLDIAVNHAGSVNGLQPERALLQHVECKFFGKFLFAREDVGKRFAPHVFHDDEAEGQPGIENFAVGVGVNDIGAVDER